MQGTMQTNLHRRFGVQLAAPLQRHSLRLCRNIKCSAAPSPSNAAAPTTADARHRPEDEGSSATTMVTCVDTRTSAATLLVAGLAASSLLLLTPDMAHASEALSGSALDAFKDLLDQIEAMGPMGAVLFVVVVMFSEMIPLFPTQPLTLASGLLFGGVKGAALVLLGVTLAAFNAYSISRGVGRSLAEKVIQYEMGEGGEANGVSKTLADVQRAIESGGFWKQFMAIMLLRLTPVVPFSASNYVLGLTPVKLPALIGGTVVGMSVWSFLYASLGGASRSLLDSGMDMATLFSELAEQSSEITKTVLIVGGGVAGVAAASFAVVKVAGLMHHHPVPPADTSVDASGSLDDLQGSKDMAFARKEEATVHAKK